MRKGNASLGPLQDGSVAVVIGGGPGGASCAIALKRLAREAGRNIEVVLYEGKLFAGESSYNQCMGVLSPPIDRILERGLNVPFPQHLVQRRITGYVLHSARRRIELDGGEPSFALRRVQFDHYLLEQARLRGVRIAHSRVSGLEFHDDRALVFSESDCLEADVVVGAFGLDDGATTAWARATPYRPPQFLTTVVIKVEAPEETMAAFGSRIHAFLPRARGVEFGAITPKSSHFVVNVAGSRVDVDTMETFLASRTVRSVLSPQDTGETESANRKYFKGRFPISTARGFYGDRYVLVGDAAGLVRAFKGKGITTACQTGEWAAEALVTRGISKAALAEAYVSRCREIMSDLPYGRAVRHLVRGGSRLGLMGLAIVAAQNEPALRPALYDAVSGGRPYRAIVGELCRPSMVARACRALWRAAGRRD